MSKEIWKDIKGYRNKYQISQPSGMVKSLFRYDTVGRPVREKILKPCYAVYETVSLCLNGKKKTVCVHRLIALAFMRNPKKKPQINHKNGIKTDNRIDNLEWATSKENIDHAFRTGLNVPKVGVGATSYGLIGSKNVNSKKVKQIDLKTGKIIKIWDSLHCVTRGIGLSYKQISLCATNKRKTAYGFNWEYL